jgi:site-specific recombinase XerD
MRPRAKGPIIIDENAIKSTEQRIQLARKSRNTSIAYRSGWRQFCAWCVAAGCSSLPASADTVKDFISWSIHYGYRLQTISVRLCAIAHFHAEAGFPRPLDGIREYFINARRAVLEDRRGKASVTYPMLLRIARTFPDTSCGIRNRSMVLLAFATGWRRSEIVGLRFRDVRLVDEGVELFLRVSKTDQTGKGRTVGIQPGRNPETCPIRALERWLSLRGDFEGPLYVRMASSQRLTEFGLEPRGEALKDALKRAIEKIGVNAKAYGAHSLRAGMITEATKHGATEASIMQRTGHRCSKTLQRYIRPAQVFDFNPLRDVL